RTWRRAVQGDSIVFEVLRPLLPGEPLCLLDAAAPPDRDSEAANDSAVPDQLAAKVPAQAGPPMSSRRRQMLPCRICAKAFDRPSLLGRHMRTHTGEPEVHQKCACSPIKYQYPELASLGRQYPELASQGRPYPELASQERQYPELASQGRQYPELASQERQYPELASQGRQYPELASQERQYQSWHLRGASTQSWHLRGASTQSWHLRAPVPRAGISGAPVPITGISEPRPLLAFHGDASGSHCNSCHEGLTEQACKALHSAGRPAQRESASRRLSATSQGPSRGRGKCRMSGRGAPMEWRAGGGEKPFACDTCGKAFSTSSSLNTHRRIHSGERPHECSACGKRFTASSNLYYHRMTHSREKPHRCAQCGKGFPTPGDLRSHAYVHSGRWPFKCAHCDRGFSKQTNLRNHELLHKGARRYECSDCPKKFSLLCNLKSHARTHAAEKSRTEAAAGPGGLPLGRSLVPHRVNFGCVDDLARPHRLMESLDADGGP
uniref:C2h2-type zn-finger protein n=1 Tax=Macrostomum lignano TaxID=282301 RepID=A0A1I8JC41_9PLAT